MVMKMAKSDHKKLKESQSAPDDRPSNGDKDRQWQIDGDTVVGLGSFHKTLPHNKYGEVCGEPFAKLKAAAATGTGFEGIDPGGERNPGDGTFKLTNPRAGLAMDRLIHHPTKYEMPPAPRVDSDTTAAEMTELYWMAMLRDVPFNMFESAASAATDDVNDAFATALADTSDPGRLKPGTDVPGSADAFAPFTSQTLFRLGLPGDDVGPMLSQFFVRPIGFGTQTIDTRQRPYKTGSDYLVQFDDWLKAQKSGKDANGQGYSDANEDHADFFEPDIRYISTMRDLARFVNKDALHQAYFNAALILLSGGAKWTAGNPYVDCGLLAERESGFGVLGGPHILALVSEVATRALKAVWNQKWQVHLRLRPEAYGGLLHVQECGADVEGANKKRAYGLPSWVKNTEAAKAIFKKHHGYLLPMAFTPGSPAHPAYGAGHATVAGACVTVLKAYFAMTKPGKDCDGKPVEKLIPFNTLVERDLPYGAKPNIRCCVTGEMNGVWERFALSNHTAGKLTIEGELNKLAQNVAMGRSIGGVHWRTDNTRSLVLGEALAAEMLHGISCDIVEPVEFTFRTFARKANGQPKVVVINKDGITVDGGNPMMPPFSAL
jgi:hypothetical protein